MQPHSVRSVSVGSVGAGLRQADTQAAPDPAASAGDHQRHHRGGIAAGGLGAVRKARCAGESDPNNGCGGGGAAHSGESQDGVRLRGGAHHVNGSAGVVFNETPPSSPELTGDLPVPATAVVEPSSRFTTQHHRPGWLQDAVFETLSAYHRLLLVNDGSTVALIEAMTLEDTRVRCISQQDTDPADPLVAWLQPSPTECALRRQVVIEGRRSHLPYLHATSVFVASRLPFSCTSLDAGIGAALQNTATETRRELLWWGRGDGTVSRSYRIVANTVPIFVVYEDFLR
jgi:chorismate-pyruvate lyase